MKDFNFGDTVIFIGGRMFLDACDDKRMIGAYGLVSGSGNGNIHVTFCHTTIKQLSEEYSSELVCDENSLVKIE